MKIKTVCELTELTDRTIRYYIEEQLISPSYTENYLGRKSFSFSEGDINLLNNISVLRKFDFSVDEIREILNNSEKSIPIIQDVKNRNRHTLVQAQIRQSVLSQIEDNRTYTIAELACELSTASKCIPNAEENSKKRFLKSVFTAAKTFLTFLIVWLPVAAQVFFFMVTLLMYAYPKFYPGAKAYMLLSVLPSVLVVLLNRIKQNWRKYARPVLLVLCTISLLCSLFVGCLPAGLMAQSETTDFDEYRDVDAECLANRDLFFSELFPVWPHYFVNEWQPDGSLKTVYLDAHYYYRYISFLDYTYDIFAQWPLEQDEFDKEVTRVKALYENHATEHDREYIVVQKGSYTCLIFYSGNPPFEKATKNYSYDIFAYDETNLIVRYIVCSSLEDGTDQPYYLSLDWK